MNLTVETANRVLATAQSQTFARKGLPKSSGARWTPFVLAANRLARLCELLEHRGLTVDFDATAKRWIVRQPAGAWKKFRKRNVD